MGSATFTFDVSEIGEIIESVKSRFNVFSESTDEKQNLISKLILSNNQYKLNLHFYGTGKCLLQGKDGEFFENIKSFLSGLKNIEPIKKVEKKILEIDEEELYKANDFIIGFDEAGKGEPIGPLVFGSVVVPKDKLALFKNLKKDIKSLDLKELNYYCELMKKHKIRFEYKIVSSLEITNHHLTMNRLMDENYIDLIRKYGNVMDGKFILAIDDYSIRDELQGYLKKLENIGVECVCQSKLDECVTATKLASIIARQIRLSHIQELDRINRLDHNGKIISFGRGANNDEMKEWLITYRIMYPTFEFPDFVRKNWDNVKEIEFRYPKKHFEFKVNCTECREKISKICIYFNQMQNKILYFCSHCNKMMDIAKLKENKFHYLLCDTNAYVAGILSKDLNSPLPLFEGSCIILPHKIKDEIETIPLSKKRGAQNELERLKQFEQAGKIDITTKDYDITDPFDADKKLYDMIAKSNSSVLISGDYNVADSAHSNGAFVFKIINLTSPHNN